jgi:hypothetical protein
MIGAKTRVVNGLSVIAPTSNGPSSPRLTVTVSPLPLSTFIMSPSRTMSMRWPAAFISRASFLIDASRSFGADPALKSSSSVMSNSIGSLAFFSAPPDAVML